MTDTKVWRMHDREWFDPSGEGTGFVYVQFQRTKSGTLCGFSYESFNGFLRVSEGGSTWSIGFSRAPSDSLEEYLLESRNKIAVIRRMLNVAEAALDRYEEEES